MIPMLSDFTSRNYEAMRHIDDGVERRIGLNLVRDLPAQVKPKVIEPSGQFEQFGVMQLVKESGRWCPVVRSPGFELKTFLIKVVIHKLWDEMEQTRHDQLLQMGLKDTRACVPPE